MLPRRVRGLRRLVGRLPVPGPFKGAPGRPDPAAAAGGGGRVGSAAAAAAPAGGLLVVLDDVIESHVQRGRHSCSAWDRSREGWVRVGERRGTRSTGRRRRNLTIGLRFWFGS